MDEQVTGVERHYPVKNRVTVIGKHPLGVVEYFKNRRREQIMLGHLLAKPSTRLVSIIGPGGMGKTALACKVLRDLEHHHWPHTEEKIPLDGIVYLSTQTAGISLERLFFDCAKMLGGEQEEKLSTIWTNPEIATEDKTSHLLNALRDGVYIILLDNIEELLDEVGHLVDQDLRSFFDHSLITTSNGVRLLVTSRMNLAFTYELMYFDQQIDLREGLPITVGIALLQELDPNGEYGIHDAPEEQLAHVVSLVSGVPRALELIVGIMANDPLTSLSELSEILGQFSVREDSIQALIEENYKRLDKDAQKIIEALALFKRPVLPLAVDYLWQPFVPGLDVPDIIQRLLDTKIITIDHTSDTITLHPIDRAYAYRQLPEGRAEGRTYTRPALEQRAADYYGQLRTSPATWQTINDLDPQFLEFDHRIRARDYDGACRVLNLIDFDYLYRWGHYARIIRLRECVLEGLTEFTLRVTSLCSLGNAYRQLKNSKQALKLYREALDIARTIGNRQEEGNILGQLSRAYYDLSQFERAIQCNKEALIIASERADQRSIGERLGHLGKIYYYLGELEHVITREEEALAIAQTIKARNMEGEIRTLLGKTYHALGHTERALDYYQKALFIAYEVGNRRVKGESLAGLGTAYRALGRFAQALDATEDALSNARKSSDRRGELTTLCHLGKIYYTRGQIKRAITHYQTALDIAHEAEEHWEKSSCLLGLGRALLAMESVSKARQCSEEALALNVPATSYQAALVLGITLLTQRDLSVAAAFTNATSSCRKMLEKTGRLYEARYTLAAALVGVAVCDPNWGEETGRAGLLSPALKEYRLALEICAAPGVIQDAICELELFRTAGIEGLEPVFELLQSAYKHPIVNRQAG